MRTLLVILAICSAGSRVTAYLEPFRNLPTQDKYSYHQIRSLENVVARLLPRMSRPERQTPATKKLLPNPAKSSGTLSSSSRGLSPGRSSLERSSSKRKESAPLANAQSQRPRTEGPSSINGGTPSKPTRNPLGKPPLHPSFKNSPAYAVKMKKLAASKAQLEEFQRNWHNFLPDTSFLSEKPKPLSSFPDPVQTHSPSYRPPAFRSQALPPSTGIMIPISG